MLRNWLKIAFINYKKNWLTTLINLLGLSMGLTIFLLVFLNWQDEKAYEKWVPDNENIYFVELEPGKNSYASNINYPVLHTSPKMFPEIENYTIANIWSDLKTKMIAEGRSAYIAPIYATEDFFKVIQFPKVAGSYENIFIDDTSIAISEDTAEQLFGSNYLNSIGKTIISDNDGSKYMVQAIYKLPVENENTIFRRGFITRQPFISENKDRWTNYNYYGFFRVKPGTDIAKLEAKISKWDDDNEKADNLKNGWADNGEPIKAHLTNLRKMKLEAKGSGVMKGDKKSIMILMSLAVLIVILSTINFINLNTAQASQRAKEVGIRKTLGSTRGKLIVQFILETAIIYSVAFIIAMVLLELLLSVYGKFLGKEIKIGSFWVYFYTILTLLVFALLSGIVPAIYLSDFKPVQTLKGNFSRSKHGIWLRNAILTIQLIISSFFIISSLIIYKQVNYMMDKDLGFSGDQVFQINFKKINYVDGNFNARKYELYKEKMKHFPGVVDITGSIQTIGNAVRNTSGAKYVKDSTKNTAAGVGAVDFNYFDFYKIKLVSGRNINPRLTTDTINSIVVNEAFVKEMGWNKEEALGKEISSGIDDRSDRLKIIGVAKNFYYGGVRNEIKPVIFFNYHRNWTKNQMTNLQIKLSGNDIEQNVERIKTYWKTEVEPDYPFEGNFVNENFARTFDKFKKQRLLFSILNSVVLVVALLGLFALSNMMIEQKLKDVAIKKTLGASNGVLIKDLTKKFLWITAIAVLLSIPVSYYFMNEWLKEFAYRIEMPWWPYVLSLVLLLLLTFFVVSIKAYRATKIELVKYLKYE